MPVPTDPLKIHGRPGPENCPLCPGNLKVITKLYITINDFAKYWYVMDAATKNKPMLVLNRHSMKLTPEESVEAVVIRDRWFPGTSFEKMQGTIWDHAHWDIVESYKSRFSG